MPPLSEEERRLADDLRRRLGLAPEEEPSLFSTITQPIRTLFGATQGVGGRALGALFPGARERAAEEVRRSFGVQAGDPWYQQLEAEPGLGDVAAELVPEGVRESTVGTALGPVGRMAGNILGDPTTYTPVVLGKATGAIARTIPRAARLMEGSEAVGKALRAADQAKALSPTLLRNSARFGEQQVRKAVLEYGGPKAAVWKAADVIRRGEPYTLGTAAAVAYGPDVVRSIGAGIERVGEAETIPEGLAAGVNTALMSGMAALMGAGLLSTGRAVRALSEDIGRSTALTASEQAEIARILRGEPEPAPDRMLGPGPEEPAIPMGPGEAQPRAPGVEETGEAIGRPYPLPEAEVIREEPLPVAEIVPDRAPPAEPVLPEAAIIEPEAAPEALPVAEAVDTPSAAPEVLPEAPAGPPAAEGVAGPALHAEPPLGRVAEDDNLVEAIDRFLNSRSDRARGRMTPEISDRFQEKLLEPEFQERLAKLAEGTDSPGQLMPGLRQIRDEIQDELEREKEVGIKGEAPPVKEEGRAGELPGRAGGAAVGRRVAEGGKLSQRQAQQEAYENAVAVAEAGGTDLVKAAQALEGARFTAMGRERPLTGNNLARTVAYFQARQGGLSRDRAFAKVANEAGVSVGSIRNTIGPAEAEVYQRVLAAATGQEVVNARAAAAPAKGGFQTLERLKQRRKELVEAAPKRQPGESTADFTGRIDQRAELERWEQELELQGEAAGKKLGRQLPIKHLKEEAVALRAESRAKAPLLDIAHKAIGKVLRAQGAGEKEISAAFKRLRAAWERGRGGAIKKEPAAKTPAAPARPAPAIAGTFQIAGFEPLKVRGRVEPGTWAGKGGTRVQSAEGRGGEFTAKLLELPKAAEGVRQDVKALVENPGLRMLDVEDVKHPELNKVVSEIVDGVNWELTEAGMGRTVIRRIAPIETMAETPRLRQHRGIDWTSPPNMEVVALRQADGRPSSINTKMVMGLLGDDASIYPQLRGRLQELRIQHDPDDLFELVGRGAFHNVFEIKGQGPGGERYILRVGKAPYLKLPTAEQRQLVMQPIGAEGLINTLGEEFTFTVHRKGIAPTVALELDKLDLHGELREKFDMLPVGAAGDLGTYMDVEAYMTREGQLPPGVSLGDHLRDQLDLYEGAKVAGLGIDDYILEDRGLNFQMVRANQTVYLPLGPNDAHNGVLRKGSDGVTYKLVFSDYGAVWPKEAAGEWGEMHPMRRVMLMRKLPDSGLTEAERQRRHLHFNADAEAGLDLPVKPKKGGKLRVVNHDRVFGEDYVKRVANTLQEPARVLADITDDLVEFINGKLPEGQRPITARYGGMTTSPYMQGLFVGWNKQGAALENEIYTNVVSGLLHGKTREEGIDHALFALMHEVAHNGGKGHDAEFQQLNEFVMHLAAAEGKLDEARKLMQEAIPEELYRKVIDDLAPEYLAERKWHGESWRDPRAEGVERIPPGDLEGRAPPVPDRGGGGPEGAAGGAVPGVRPDQVVPGGAGRQAGGAGAAAAPQVGAAGRPAVGEAVRRGAGRGADQAEAAYPRLVQRIEALHEEGLTVESAHKEMDELLKRVPKGRPVNGALDHAYNLAIQIEQALPDAEVERWAEVVPSPRAKGQVEGPLNLTHLPDVPERLKARIKIWWELSKRAWDRSKTESWDSVGRDVQDILGLHTPEEWVVAMKRAKRPLKTHDVFILQEVHNEMAGRIGQAEMRWGEAVAKGLDEAKLEPLWREVDEARRVYQHVAHTLSSTMTGFARGLAAGRRTVRQLDPRLRWEQDMLAGLRERLRTEIKDPKELERVARDLFDKLQKIQQGGGDWEGFYRALRMVHKNPVRRIRDMALEWYKAGLIGVPSRAANLTSNALFRKVRYLEDAVAAGLDFTRSKLTGTEREVYLGEATVASMALKRSFMEGARDWIADTKSALLLEPEDMEKIMSQGGIAEDYMHMGGAIPGKVGRFIRFHFRGLNADDGWAKHVSRTDTYYREVYRRIRKGQSFFKARPGESVAAATERIVDDLVGNHRKALEGEKFDSLKAQLFEPIQKKAEGLARDDTFQKQLGPGMQRVQTLLRGPAWIFQTIFPFVRTPTNIFLETIKRTPLGFVDAAAKWKKLSPAEQMQALARPTVGTMIGAFFLNDALDGDLSGGGPINPDERAALQSLGWQPYSRRIEVDGKTHWVAYNRLEPVASIVGIAADAAEGLRQGDWNHWQDGVERVMKSVAENLTNKTFLSGLDTMLAAMSHPKQFLPTFIRQMQGSVVPNSIGFVPFGHLARALDPVYRSTDAFSADVFWSKVPFASQNLDPQYAPTGDTRLRPGTFGERLLLPFARRVEEVGPRADATREIVRLQAAPRAPAREWISPQGLRVRYTKEERARMARALEQAVDIIGQRLIRDPSYQRLPDTEMDSRYQFGQKTKKDVVEALIRKYRRRALVQIRPGLQRRAREEFRMREGV